MEIITLFYYLYYFIYTLAIVGLFGFPLSLIMMRRQRVKYSETIKIITNFGYNQAVKRIEAEHLVNNYRSAINALANKKCSCANPFKNVELNFN